MVLANLIVCLLITFWPGGTVNDSYPLMFFMFLIGVLSAGRTAVGYCWLVEICPERMSALGGTAWNVFEGLIYVWITLWFMTGHKDWRFPMYISFVLSTLTISAMIFFPESPKFLLDKDRKIECYHALNKMAKYNGVEDLDGDAKQLLFDNFELPPSPKNNL